MNIHLFALLRHTVRQISHFWLPRIPVCSFYLLYQIHIKPDFHLLLLYIKHDCREHQPCQVRDSHTAVTRMRWCLRAYREDSNIPFFNWHTFDDTIYWYPSQSILSPISQIWWVRTRRHAARFLLSYPVCTHTVWLSALRISPSGTPLCRRANVPYSDGTRTVCSLPASLLKIPSLSPRSDTAGSESPGPPRGTIILSPACRQPPVPSLPCMSWIHPESSCLF